MNRMFEYRSRHGWRIAPIEAHRDGVNSGDQQESETYNAVLAHTKMAMDMENDYRGLISSSYNLTQDVAKYMEAEKAEDMSKFEEYAKVYKSEKDYWELRADGTLSPDGHLNIYREGSQHSEEAKATDGLVLDFREMEDLLKTAEVDEDGFIKLKDGLKVKASDLEIAMKDNKAVEKDLKKRIKKTEKNINRYDSSMDKEYLERLKTEMAAMSDGHVSYHESEEMRKDVSNTALGITRFEHNNMRTVLNKNWEFEQLTKDDIKDFIQSVRKGESYLGDSWEIKSSGQSVYHSPTGTGKDIIKLVSSTGREVIIDPETSKPIFNGKYGGTFNYKSSKNKFDHFTNDMAPYWIWKNNAMDNSRLSWRLHPTIDSLFFKMKNENDFYNSFERSNSSYSTIR